MTYFTFLYILHFITIQKKTKKYYKLEVKTLKKNSIKYLKILKMI